MFGDDLKLLADRAYPDLPDKARERFLSLLYKVQVAKQKAVDEAVCLTLVMRSYMQPNRPNKVPATLPDDYKSDVISAASTHTRADPLQQILQWMDRFEMVLKKVQQTKVGPSSGQCFS